ncbi:IclR family transcriptional regulator [Herbiconiux sp. KACC 21604]|uniref:IclR family transcriptional regulator n=1 Tax=unclassified Herbiconiux TaxID=2618217 RepID=UPI00149131FC|nr:IclR family transcriptional regulator [Herbiconiux sp. SALV-R1]QJU55318.1 IclR family transcriptional regulator [Herbiconiux sp. SALV-R1]WPO86486.1 IclR family transcriptional regulator [Herbiconiux sp. KACC 21604]
MRSAQRASAPSMISRVSDILQAFGHDERSMTVSELGRRTGIPKASTSRIAAELVGRGLLEREGDQIRLGIRLFELGQQASRPVDLRRLAFPHMTELMRATGQTVHLAILDGSEVVYIQILRSRATPPLPSRVGGRLPAHSTGVGKVLLAYAPSAVVDELCAHPLPSVGPRTITDPDRLRRELGAIRANRLAFEREETAANVGCAAAPILGPDGEPVAALSVSAHLHITDLSKMGPAVSTVAMTLSREARQLSLSAS